MKTRGGSRIGAGRKPNSGKFKEPTKAIRIPESYVQPITQWLNSIQQNTDTDNDQNISLDVLDSSLFVTNVKKTTKPILEKDIIKPLNIVHADAAATVCDIPFYDCSVSAGFPSPADDSFSITMDLNKHLVQNAPATFFVRTSGESMLNAGIHDGDLLVVDRSLTAKNLDIVIAAVDGDLTVKRLVHGNGKTILKAENPEFSDIELTGDMAVSLWGVVTNVIHNLRT